MSLLIVLFVLVVVSFVFTGVEAAFLSLSPERVRQRAGQDTRVAMRIERLMERPDRLLLLILLVTNACNIAALAVLVRFATQHLGPTGYLLAGAAALPLWLILLGVLPKGLFRSMPYRSLAALVQPLELCMRVMDPVTRAFEKVTLPLAQAATGRSHSAGALREELKFLTEASERAGDLTPIERAMIHDVLDFRSLTAESVMIPWEKVIFVSLDTPYDEIIHTARTHQVDRMPVVDPSGNVAGLVLTLDVLLDGSPGHTAKHFLRHIVSVQPREPAHRIIRRLRSARITLAVVRPENRPASGIVTNEDLIARLVQNAAADASPRQKE